MRHTKPRAHFEMSQYAAIVRPGVMGVKKHESARGRGVPLSPGEKKLDQASQLVFRRQGSAATFMATMGTPWKPCGERAAAGWGRAGFGGSRAGPGRGGGSTRTRARASFLFAFNSFTEAGNPCQHSLPGRVGGANYGFRWVKLRVLVGKTTASMPATPLAGGANYGAHAPWSRCRRRACRP